MTAPQYGKPFKEKIPSGYKAGALQQMTPQQIKLLEEMIGQLGPESFLSRLAGGDQSMFEEMEAPALRQFGELQGNIASRFSGMGTGGRRSSGFQNTMNSAAANFAESLQSKRTDLRRQALEDLMGFSNQLLGQRPYERFLQKKEQSSSGWGGLAGAGLGAAGGFLLGGPAGAMAGGQLGYGIGSSF